MGQCAISGLSCWLWHPMRQCERLGDEGHKIVCEIAFRLAQPDTRAAARELIRSDTEFVHVKSRWHDRLPSDAVVDVHQCNIADRFWKSIKKPRRLIMSVGWER
jgi:hypothetical protein